ncbi:hypothetical protein [Streptomyces sp. NRRL S-495]|uniref:hypothetical protein n=1 Tax=Streptomyces sp. NRRL S-495 TaxID=1609133 RepID=UPI00133157DB|nr:hypothetical protein [Streptomyces sp. NRRL S-495]
MSVVVAGAAFGLATPSHAVERETPAPTAYELTQDAAATHPVPDRANQGHY